MGSESECSLGTSSRAEVRICSARLHQSFDSMCLKCIQVLLKHDLGCSKLLDYRPCVGCAGRVSQQLPALGFSGEQRRRGKEGKESSVDRGLLSPPGGTREEGKCLAQSLHIDGMEGCGAARGQLTCPCLSSCPS